MQLKLDADPAPKAARLWSAPEQHRDFRQAKWSEQPLAIAGTKITANMEIPPAGFVAFFAEMDYEMDGFTYRLSSQLHIAGQ